MPESLFKRYLDTVNLIAQWRNCSEIIAPSAVDATAALTEKAVSTSSKLVTTIPKATAANLPNTNAPAKPLPKRTPLRPPKPNTLRATVHQVLREGAKPMQRCAIIAAVALKRGVRVDDNFRAAVGEVLNSKFDPAIKKVSRGVYMLGEPEMQVSTR